MNWDQACRKFGLRGKVPRMKKEDALDKHGRFMYPMKKFPGRNPFRMAITEYVKGTLLDGGRENLLYWGKPSLSALWGVANSIDCQKVGRMTIYFADATGFFSGYVWFPTTMYGRTKGFSSAGIQNAATRTYRTYQTEALCPWEKLLKEFAKHKRAK